VLFVEHFDGEALPVTEGFFLLQNGLFERFPSFVVFLLEFYHVVDVVENGLFELLLKARLYDFLGFFMKESQWESHQGLPQRDEVLRLELEHMLDLLNMIHFKPCAPLFESMLEDVGLKS